MMKKSKFGTLSQLASKATGGVYGSSPSLPVSAGGGAPASTPSATSSPAGTAVVAAAAPNSAPGGAVNGTRRITWAERVREKLPPLGEHEYEVLWERGVLGVIFLESEKDGIPYVSKATESCISPLVAPGDVLKFVNHVRSKDHSFSDFFKILATMKKPVLLRFERMPIGAVPGRAVDATDPLDQRSNSAGDIQGRTMKGTAKALAAKVHRSNSLPKDDGKPQMQAKPTLRGAFWRSTSARDPPPAPQMMVAPNTPVMRAERSPVVKDHFQEDLEDATDSDSPSNSSFTTTPSDFDDSYEYEVYWETGSLGLFFGEERGTGQPVVTRAGTGANPAVQLKVAVNDVLLSANGVQSADFSFEAFFARLQQMNKPVKLVFRRRRVSPTRARKASVTVDAIPDHITHEQHTTPARSSEESMSHQHPHVSARPNRLPPPIPRPDVVSSRKSEHNPAGDTHDIVSDSRPPSEIQNLNSFDIMGVTVKSPAKALASNSPSPQSKSVVQHPSSPNSPPAIPDGSSKPKHRPEPLVVKSPPREARKEESTYNEPITSASSQRSEESDVRPKSPSTRPTPRRKLKADAIFVVDDDDALSPSSVAKMKPKIIQAEQTEPVQCVGNSTDDDIAEGIEVDMGVEADTSEVSATNMETDQDSLDSAPTESSDSEQTQLEHVEVEPALPKTSAPTSATSTPAEFRIENLKLIAEMDIDTALPPSSAEMDSDDGIVLDSIEQDDPDISAELDGGEVLSHAKQKPGAGSPIKPSKAVLNANLAKYRKKAKNSRPLAKLPIISEQEAHTVPLTAPTAVNTNIQVRGRTKPKPSLVDTPDSSTYLVKWKEGRSVGLQLREVRFAKGTYPLVVDVCKDPCCEALKHVCIGDVIVEINGRNCSTMGVKKTVNFLKTSSKTMLLKFRHGPAFMNERVSAYV